MTHADRILAAIPHVWPLYVAFVLILGVSYLIVRAVDAVRGRNPYAPSPETEAARAEMRERAWGE